MAEIRRGKAAIQEVVDSKGEGGGPFRKWIPAIFWKEADEERYLLILNEIENIPTFEMIGFIKTEQGFTQETVARTDPYFGEGSDPFVTQWDAKPRQTSLAVAVELEPTVEVRNGRKKPTGFEVKTVEYNRTILDDEGNPTDEKEEVTAPAIGVIAQSPYNFFNEVSSFDATEAPIQTTPIKIKKVGKGTATSYSITGYEDQDLDLTNLIEYWENINYISDDVEALTEAIDGLDPLDAAHLIGDLILDKRIDEVLDEERYDELFEGVHESMAWGGGKKDKGGKATKSPKTKSSRKAEAKEEPVEETDESAEVEEKTEAKAKPSAQERMAALQERAAKKAKSAA